jgi:hypothetical protein
VSRSAAERAPHKFTNRLTNQVKMVAYGVPKSGVLAPCGGEAAPQLGETLEMSVRRTPNAAWTRVQLPARCVSVLLVNIRSHAAGRKPWQPCASPWVPSSQDDGLIDIVVFSSPIHAAKYLAAGFGRRWQAALGASATKLCQAAAVQIELKQALYAQADGEPWLQPAGTIAVEFGGTCVVLRRPERARFRRWQSRTMRDHAEQIHRERHEFEQVRAALLLQAMIRYHLARKRSPLGEDSTLDGVTSGVARALTRLRVHHSEHSKEHRSLAIPHVNTVEALRI